MFPFQNLFRKKSPAPAAASAHASTPANYAKAEEHTRILIAKCTEHLIRQLQDSIPTEGRFERNFVCFDNRIPTWYMEQCGMMIEFSHADPYKRVLQVYATYPEDNRMVSNYMKTGTNDELIAYLSAPDLAQELFETYAHLSESIRRSD